MELLRDFKNISKDDVSLAGGKGASLGEMTQAGIPVPPGFVILASAFEKFLGKTDLNVEIDAILDSVNHKEMHTVENASEKIKALILSAEIPKDIAIEIQKFFKNLNSKYVAVRSSATAEDSSSAAWAGQLDSYLNTTKENLLENIKKCWASLFTPRAIFYRFEKELHKQKISVAVVVQKMVESEVSGVAFSVHPVTQDENQLIIEAGFGLGESIVSGQITPDSYVVKKEPRRILDKNVFVQARGLYRAEKRGNEWQDIQKEIGENQVLSDKEIMELLEIILNIEKHYGFPVDIEWARERNEFFIVQSRPITTLSPTKRVESKRNLVKEFVLDSSTWTYKGFHGVLHTFFPVGRVGPAMKDFFDDASKITVFFVKDDYVHWYWNDNDLTRIREKFLKRLRKNEHYLEELKKEWGVKVERLDDILHEIDKTDLQKLSNEELSSLYDNFYERYVEQFKYFMVLGDAVSMHADRYLIPEFQKILGNDFTNIFPKLLTTKYPSFLEEESMEREKLLKILRNEGTVPNKALKDHAKNFFYIHNNYAKGIRLTADDFDKMLHEDLKKNVEPAKDVRKQRLKEKQKLIKKYDLSPWHQTLLYIMDEFFKIQDTRKKHVLVSSYYQFEFLKEVEQRSGMPFKLLQYSIYPEFRKALERKIDKKIFEGRREICVCIHAHDTFDVVYGSDAQHALDFFQKGVGDQKELKGMIASTGKIRGRVKKILKIHDMANMEKGDILVSSMTRPEMVPAMKLAAAIVTDEGGVTSHAAIVSRELGIPCIIGTKTATQIFKDGDIIEVDADNGVVKLLKEQDQETYTHMGSVRQTQFIDRPPIRKEGKKFLMVKSIEKRLGGRQWYHQRFDGSPMYLSMIGEAETKTEQRKPAGTEATWRIGFFENGGADWFLDQEDINRGAKIISDLTEKSETVSEDLMEKWKEDEKQFEKYFWEFGEKKLDKLNNDGLYQEFDTCHKLAIPNFTSSSIIDHFSLGTDEKIAILLRKEAGPFKQESAFTKVFSIATAPVHQSFINEAEIFLLQIGILVQKGQSLDSSKIQELIAKHQEKYFWINNNYIKARILSVEYFKEEIESWLKTKKDLELELDKIKKTPRDNQRAKKELLAKYNFTPRLRRLLKISEDFTKWQDDRKRATYFSIHIGNLILGEMARRRAIDSELTKYLLPSEVKTWFFNGDISKKELMSRKKKCAVIWEKERENIYIGKAIDELRKIILGGEKEIDIQDIRGLVASTGRAIGIARIVKSAEEVDKVQKGDILIAVMTRPDYVPAMKKAAAIVTEEGGITSHAAIVSREFGIPCIIGTKIATKVFKDGDRIEVNANHNWVRKLD